MKIFVKTLAGKVYELEVKPSNTIKAVKEKIFQRYGILPEKQELILDGK